MSEAPTVDVFLANTLGPFHTFPLSLVVQLALKSTTPPSPLRHFFSPSITFPSSRMALAFTRDGRKGSVFATKVFCRQSFALPLTQLERDMTPIRTSLEETLQHPHKRVHSTIRSEELRKQLRATTICLDFRGDEKTYRSLPHSIFRRVSRHDEEEEHSKEDRSTSDVWSEPVQDHVECRLVPSPFLTTLDLEPDRGPTGSGAPLSRGPTPRTRVACVIVALSFGGVVRPVSDAGMACGSVRPEGMWLPWERGTRVDEIVPHKDAEVAALLSRDVWRELEQQQPLFYSRLRISH